MRSSTQPEPSHLPQGSRMRQSTRSEDLVYQAVTIASILLVLVSAWVF